MVPFLCNEKLDILRDFRDNVLEKNIIGKTAVDIYYETSPPLAEYISKNNALRIFVREAIIDPIADLLNLTQNIWNK